MSASVPKNPFDQTNLLTLTFDASPYFLSAPREKVVSLLYNNIETQVASLSAANPNVTFKVKEGDLRSIILNFDNFDFTVSRKGIVEASKLAQIKSIPLISKFCPPQSCIDASDAKIQGLMFDIFPGTGDLIKIDLVLRAINYKNDSEVNTSQLVMYPRPLPLPQQQGSKGNLSEDEKLQICVDTPFITKLKDSPFSVVKPLDSVGKNSVPTFEQLMGTGSSYFSAATAEAAAAVDFSKEVLDQTQKIPQTSFQQMLLSPPPLSHSPNSHLAVDSLVPNNSYQRKRVKDEGAKADISSKRSRKLSDLKEEIECEIPTLTMTRSIREKKRNTHYDDIYEIDLSE